MNLTNEQCLVLVVQIGVGFVCGFLINHFRLKAKRFRELYIDAGAVLLQTQIQNSHMKWDLIYANQKIAVLEGKDGEGWKA